MPLTRSAVDSDNEQSNMDNQPETASGLSTNMEVLLALLQQQTERLAQQQADCDARQADRDARQEERDARQADRDARQEESDARREERFTQQLAQLDERLTERLRFHLDEVRDAFAEKPQRVHHEVSEQTDCLKNDFEERTTLIDKRLERLEEDFIVSTRPRNELSAPTSETSVPVPAVVRRERCTMRQRPPKYDGKSIWESFRAQLEIVAELNAWTSAEMAAFLATSLEGSAANVIASMETSKRRDYAALVDALETRLGTAVQKELNRVKLRSIRRLKGESLSDVADEVERQAHLAYNDAPATTQDTHAKEHFVDAITDDDLRVRVLQTRPVTLQDALRSALELENTLAVRRTPPVRTMSVDTAMKQELPELVKQLLTELSVNMATQLNQMVGHRCPEPRTTDSRNDQFRGVCWNCGEVGHYSRQCPYALNGRWQQHARWGSGNRSYPGTSWQPPPQQGNDRQPTSRAGDQL